LPAADLQQVSHNVFLRVAAMQQACKQHFLRTAALYHTGSRWYVILLRSFLIINKKNIMQRRNILGSLFNRTLSVVYLNKNQMKTTKKAHEMSREELASYIDQSVLKPEFTQQEIRKYIQEGIDFGCKTVCINPSSLPIARELCKGTDTKICVVCDFPFGLSTTNSKTMQAEEYCKNGDIYELDIVANYGWIKSGMWKEVETDIKAVCDTCHKYNTAVKVIFETDALTLEEVKKATETAIAAGADFVKTSTGFFTGGKSEGATVEVIQAMMDVAKGRTKIKGSGGIRTQEHFFKLIDMGIDRMGIGYKSTPVVLGLISENKGGSGY
jgi:deoxyribose-phosphate aldolase